MSKRLLASLTLSLVSCLPMRVSRHEMDDMKVPVGIDIVDPSDINTAIIRLCAVNFASHKQFPSMMPFFSNVVEASACNKYIPGENGPEGLDSRVGAITVGQALAQVRKHFGQDPSTWLAPIGVITHMARCGSTVVANMFASAPNIVLLAEAEPLFKVLTAESLVAADKQLLLQLVAHLYVHGATTQAAFHALQLEEQDKENMKHRDRDSFDVIQGFGSSFVQHWRMVWKMQSNTVPYLELLRRALPSPRTEFAFLYRDALPVMVSMLKPSESGRQALVDSPCLVSRARPHIPHYIMRRANISDQVGPRSVFALTAECYCAVHIAHLEHKVLVLNAMSNNKVGECSGEAGAAAECEDPRASVKSPILLVNYNELPLAVPDLLMPHFGINLDGIEADRWGRGEGTTDEGSGPQREAVLAAARLNAKAHSMKFSPDSAVKRRQASPAIRRWAQEYVQPVYSRLERMRKGQRWWFERRQQQGEGKDEEEEDEDPGLVDLAGVFGNHSSSSSVSSDAELDAERLLSDHDGGDPPLVAMGAGGQLLHSGDWIGTDPYPGCMRAMMEESEDINERSQLIMQQVAEIAMGLFTKGRMLEAEMCWRLSLSLGGSYEDRRSTLQNLALLEDVLERRVKGNRRIYHGFHGGSHSDYMPSEATAASLFQHISPPAPSPLSASRQEKRTKKHKKKRHKTRKQKGPSSSAFVGITPSAVAKFAPTVQVYENVLSPELCDYIIRLFHLSVSEHISGNVLRGKDFVVDPREKLVTELDISHSHRMEWMGLEWMLLQASTAALLRYEHANPGYSMLPNPLGYEGYRVKHYRNSSNSDGNGGGAAADPYQHWWHADLLSEGAACRVLALLFYLNDVEEGGETLFLTPARMGVRPRRGSLLMFPTSPSHVHAGAPPISGDKYIIANFLTMCDRDGQVHPQPLPQAMSLELRRHWQTAPDKIVPSVPLPDI